jgi:hypothetical protein
MTHPPPPSREDPATMTCPIYQTYLTRKSPGRATTATKQGNEIPAKDGSR